MSLTQTTSSADAIALFFAGCSDLIKKAVLFKKAKNDRALTQLARFHDKGLLSRTCHVSALDSHCVQFLLFQAAGEDVEVSLSVQGIIAAKALLPIICGGRKTAGSNKPNGLMQSIKIISSPDDEEFKNAVAAIATIYTLMASYSPNILPRQKHFVGEHEAIYAETRLFTQAQETSLAAIQAMPNLDPSTVIADTNRAGTHKYTEDNRVDVYERVTDGDKFELRDLNPAFLRPGDVVDVGLAFRVIHGKIFQIKLDSIVLVDARGSEELSKFADNLPTASKGPAKRKAIS